MPGSATMLFDDISHPANRYYGFDIRGQPYAFSACVFRGPVTSTRYWTLTGV